MFSSTLITKYRLIMICDRFLCLHLLHDVCFCGLLGSCTSTSCCSKRVKSNTSSWEMKQIGFFSVLTWQHADLTSLAYISYFSFYSQSWPEVSTFVYLLSKEEAYVTVKRHLTWFPMSLLKK